MKNIKLIGRTVAVGFALVFVCTYLAGCGDETTKVTESIGLAMVEEGGNLPKCTKENEGRMVYVVDSATTFVCEEKEWLSLKGEVGENGSSCTAKELKDKSGFELVCDGKKVGTIKNGEKGEDGSSCTAKALKDKSGFELICDGKKVGTIKNGEDGDNGSSCEGEVEKDGSITIKCDGEKVGTLKNGEKGKSATCTATENADENGYDIICAGTKVGTVKNGDDGKSAFEIAQEADASITDVAEWLESMKGAGCSVKEKGIYVVVTCGSESVTFPKAVCGTEPYDVKKSFCYDGKVYSRCGSVADGVEVIDPPAKLEEDGSYNPTISFCAANNRLYPMYDEIYDPMEQFVFDGFLHDLCGGKAYMTYLEYCKNGVVSSQPRCGDGEEYDPTSQVCDSRYSVAFSYKIIGGKKWLSVNLHHPNTTTGMYCYSGSSNDCDRTLYTWDAAKARCPEGWSLPTSDDFKEYVQSGQTLEKAGYYSSGTHYYRNERGYYWTNKEKDGSNAYSIKITEDSTIEDDYFPKNTVNLSVRCVAPVEN